MARRRKTGNDPTLDPTVEKVVKQIRRAEHAYHDSWRSEVDKRHDEYHAIVDVPDDVPEWQSQIFQPHLIPIIEGMIASMVEPNPRLVVRPRPRPSETPEEAIAAPGRRGDRGGGGQLRAGAGPLPHEAAALHAAGHDHRADRRQVLLGGEASKKVWTREFYEEEEYDEEARPARRCAPTPTSSPRRRSRTTRPSRCSTCATSSGPPTAVTSSRPTGWLIAST